MKKPIQPSLNQFGPVRSSPARPHVLAFPLTGGPRLSARACARTPPILLTLPRGADLSAPFPLAHAPRPLSAQCVPPVSADPWTPPVRPVPPNRPRARSCARRGLHAHDARQGRARPNPAISSCPHPTPSRLPHPCTRRALAVTSHRVHTREVMSPSVVVSCLAAVESSLRLLPR